MKLDMPRQPVFLVLPGATSNRERRQSLLEHATSEWPEARSLVPDYLSRLRGIAGVGRWLDRWLTENVPSGEPVYAFAFILGAAALPYAPLVTSRLERLVVLRSRYQEGVPMLLRRRFGALGASVIAGRSVAELGKPPFWPNGFRPPSPMITLVETRPTRLATRLGVRELSDRDLGIKGAFEVHVDHDLAYYSADLMRTAVAWLRDGHLPMSNGNERGMSQ